MTGKTSPSQCSCLVGGTIGATTVSDIVAWLKADPAIPPWRKFRLALIVLVEGIMLCRTQPVKPSIEVVEIVKNVHFFLNYPWGRHAFSRTLRMIKVGNHITSTASLVTKLNQFSLAVHGFPLAIQLHAFNYISLLLRHLPHADEHFTFLDQHIKTLSKLKSYHTSNILQVEYNHLVSLTSSNFISFLSLSHTILITAFLFTATCSPSCSPYRR